MGRLNLHNKKKFTSGEATAYLSLKQSLRKLQLSIKDFKHICILKGIYPQEPKHRKKVGRGATFARTYYHVKDIQFLLHEPIIDKLRALRVSLRKLKKAKERKDEVAAKRIQLNIPRYTLANVIKERYPSELDAIRDLDDCLTLTTLFSRLPIQKCVYQKLVQQCRHRVVEFMNYVIQARALRKVFIAIQGVYLECEIKGESVNWIMPHAVNIEPATSIQLKTMQAFVEFYVAMLGFVNFSLYKHVGLVYPPKLQFAVDDINTDHDEQECEFQYLASLAQPLLSLEGNSSLASSALVQEELEQQAELTRLVYNTDQSNTNQDTENVELALSQRLLVERKKRLFSGHKIFLGREVPHELLCFVIRACGGQVSWEPFCGVIGHTFVESDSNITYHIVDRLVLRQQYLLRAYVQPQWVFDSVNAGVLLPTQGYAPGAVLPPHLSPFSASGQVFPGMAPYVPSNELLYQDDKIDVSDMLELTDNTITNNDSEMVKMPQIGDDKLMKNAFVLPGVMNVHKTEVQDNEQLKLREKLLPKRHRELYKKMVFSRKRAAKEVKKLEQRRNKLTEQNKIGSTLSI